MQITEIRIKLMDDPHERLQAFCSITFDSAFVIRDLKIIQGTRGPFVAMPSRKLTDRCPRCHTKNHLRALHCNQCGVRLDENRALRDDEGRAKLYADIAHPINCDCREQIQARVLEAYELEVERSLEPGYVCTYDDFGEDGYAALRELDDAPLETTAHRVHTSPTDGAPRRPGPAADRPEDRHHVDPPGEPGPPHGGAPARRRETVHAAAENGSSPDDDEPFAAGL